jgi:hypothetical protein
VIVVGTTESPDFPVTTGPAFGGLKDVFVAKFSNNGSLVFSRLVGGSQEESLHTTPQKVRPQVADFDTSGLLYVVGTTKSSGKNKFHMSLRQIIVDFPLQNSLQPAIGTDTSDAFVVKINTTNGTLAICCLLQRMSSADSVCCR